MKSRIDTRNYRTDTVLYCTNQVIKHETSVSCKKFEKIVSKINVKYRATVLLNKCKILSLLQLNIKFN